jgi:membrane-associated phospholipid phosphatase
LTESWPRRWQQADTRLSARLRVAEQPGGRRRLAALLAHSGDSWYWLLVLAVGWAASGPAWKVFILQLVLGILATAFVVMVIKLLVRRRRPAGEWGAFYRRTDPHSFPSGHAARMAMLAVAGFALGHPWFGLVLVVWAPLVAVARVAMGVHYVSDVVGGLIIGVAVGLMLGWLL